MNSLKNIFIVLLFAMLLPNISASEEKLKLFKGFYVGMPREQLLKEVSPAGSDKDHILSADTFSLFGYDWTGVFTLNNDKLASVLLTLKDEGSLEDVISALGNNGYAPISAEFNNKRYTISDDETLDADSESNIKRTIGEIIKYKKGDILYVNSKDRNKIADSHIRFVMLKYDDEDNTINLLFFYDDEANSAEKLEKK